MASAITKLCFWLLGVGLSILASTICGLCSRVQDVGSRVYGELALPARSFWFMLLLTETLGGEFRVYRASIRLL